MQRANGSLDISFSKNEIGKVHFTTPLRVFNNDNSGNYVLAVGDIEKFNALVIGKMMLVLPKINKKFWNKNNCS